eukprot:7471235-Alexandrium_andersonii.AAC.1
MESVWTATHKERMPHLAAGGVSPDPTEPQAPSPFRPARMSDGLASGAPRGHDCADCKPASCAL